jgi:hypothetical protein
VVIWRKVGIEFGDWIFWRNFWRRGTHVNIPKIGSRGEGKCLGEFWGVYADLRREFKWGNFKLGFLGVFLVSPREPIEEGGHLCVFLYTIGGI